MNEKMTHADNAVVAEVNAAVVAVIDLMQRMTLVIEEENRILSQGMPASLASTSARKNELADQFERWANRVRTAQIEIGRVDTEMRAKLLESTKALRAVMEQNVVWLRIAMEASRRRVEAVMNAIREQISSNSPYGANGRVQDRKVTSAYGGAALSI
jgi:hypothetical protein